MVTAIVLGAGKGTRMKTDIPKQFIKLRGKEILYYSLNTFEQNELINSIVLVVPKDDIEYCKKNICERYHFSKVSYVVAGGKERFDSVYNGLQMIKNKEDDIVMIHDGARPFVTHDMIYESIKNVAIYKACTVAVPETDTVKLVDKKFFSISTLDRGSVYRIQTPQTFSCEIVKHAYELFQREKKTTGVLFDITDDSMMVERYTSVKTKIIGGSYDNIKITTPNDLKIAEKTIDAY